jgi:hypothetical protein
MCLRLVTTPTIRAQQLHKPPSATKRPVPLVVVKRRMIASAPITQLETSALIFGTTAFLGNPSRALEVARPSNSRHGG